MGRSQRNIRQTLRRALFDAPSPIDRAGFEAAAPVLFPNPSAFLRFLDADGQQMEECALSILQDLLCTAPCAPPTSLLVNLYHFESHECTTVKGGDYVPRDHCVHLVHLYLLGVYVFSYHENIGGRCLTELQKLRHAAQGQVGKEIKSSPFELFAMYWSSFVLYHDLGYPLERIVPSERGENAQWLAPFRGIRRSIAEDVALKAIVRLIVVEVLVGDSPDTFRESYIDHLDGADITASGEIVVKGMDEGQAKHLGKTLTDWADADHLVNVTGQNDLRLLRAVLPKMKLAAYFQEAYGDGRLSAYETKNGAEFAHSDCLIPRGERSRAIRALIKDGTGRVFLTGEARGGKWQYFAKNPQKQLEDAAKSLLGECYDHYRTLYASVRDTDEFRRVTVSGRDSALLLETIAFRRILEIRRSFDREVGGIRDRIEAARRSREDAVNRVPDLVADAVGRVLRQMVKVGEVELLGAYESGAGEGVVAQVRSKMRSKGFLDELSNLVQEGVDREVSAPIRLRQAADECARELSERIHFRESERDPLSKVEFSESTSLMEVATGGLVAPLDRHLAKVGLGSLRELIGAYRPSWVKDARIDRKAFADHGFSSCIVALTCAEEYHRYFTDSTADGVARPVLSGAARGKCACTALMTVSFIKSRVAASIAIHNVYPASLVKTRAATGPRPAYRTSLSTQPLTYLALLVDSLQKWDRKALAMNPREYLPGSRYDLKVEDDRFSVDMQSANIDMATEERAIRKVLRDFLRDGDSIVRLNLREFDK